MVGSGSAIPSHDDPRPGSNSRCKSNRREPALWRWPPASDGPRLRHRSRHGGDLLGANRFDGLAGLPAPAARYVFGFRRPDDFLTLRGRHTPTAASEKPRARSLSAAARQCQTPEGPKRSHSPALVAGRSIEVPASPATPGQRKAGDAMAPPACRIRYRPVRLTTTRADRQIGYLSSLSSPASKSSIPGTPGSS